MPAHRRALLSPRGLFQVPIPSGLAGLDDGQLLAQFKSPLALRRRRPLLGRASPTERRRNAVVLPRSRRKRHAPRHRSPHRLRRSRRCPQQRHSTTRPPRQRPGSQSTTHLPAVPRPLLHRPLPETHRHPPLLLHTPPQRRPPS